MAKIVINVGDRIELTHVKSVTKRKLEKSTFTSQLLEFDNIRTAKISMPIFEGKIIPLELGDEFDLCFFAASGLYRCRGKVTARAKENNIYTLTMEFLSLPKKYQRRQFYRLDCMFTIRFREISTEEQALREFIQNTSFEDMAMYEAYEQKLEEFQVDWQEALMTDISGGGVRMQSKVSLLDGTHIELAMPLEMQSGTIPFKSLAKVVMNIKLGGENQYELRCEFEEIDKQKRELIVKYVFEEQKRRMRKETF